LQFCTHTAHPAVEIIWPGDTTGPVDKLVQRHTSGIIYHLCYETDDLRAALAGLEADALRPICISAPTPAPLFGGRPVSFYNVVGMGLIEILE
jgi:methylmalonyl-CoA/ethylmalonyl-CoA epimerase